MTLTFNDLSDDQLDRMFSLFVRSASLHSVGLEDATDEQLMEAGDINDESTILARELGLI